MIIYKTQQEIDIMAQGGKILSHVLDMVVSQVKPGITTKELNKLAEDLIEEKGGRPAFKGYKISPEDTPYPTALCTSINSEVVHGPANTDRILQEGDILGLDIGVEYQGFYTDMARTVPVGQISDKAKKLLQVTREALLKGIEEFKEGNSLADIAKAIQAHVEANDFSVIRELVGHGVGKNLHEDPRVPNYFTQEATQIKIEKGMTIAIEPMVSIGDWPLKVLNDGWTYATKDGSLSAQFEHSVALDHNGKTRILTQ